jgi:4'-phosphopantetheinyl transferase
MTLLNCAWSPPPEDLVLLQDEIHIWRAFLDQPLSLVERFAQTLSADERARAERYYFVHDKQHFIVARGLLRSILGNYTNVEPGHLEFCSGPYGKLALTQTSSRYALHFNLSHSHGLALYAFTRDQEVGIDLEYIRPIAEAQQIAERYFSLQKRNTLRNLPSADLDRQFFTYWTRMEAYLKACGDGLRGIDDYELTKDNSISASWSIQSLIPAPGYIAALAVLAGFIGDADHYAEVWRCPPTTPLLRVLYYEWEPK